MYQWVIFETERSKVMLKKCSVWFKKQGYQEAWNERVLSKNKYYIITTAKYNFHCQISPFPLVFGTKGNTAA